MKQIKRKNISAALRSQVWTKYNGKIFEATCYVCQNLIDVQKYRSRAYYIVC